MKRDNKKALYESIMTSVAREVKKVLNEGKYGPTGKEATMKLNSPECKRLQSILDEYNELGKIEAPKYFEEEWDKLQLLFPTVYDGESRRLSRHMEYDDIFIVFPHTTIYYIINRDELFSFSVSYGGYGSGSYVSGEYMSYDVNVFGSKSARFFYNLIKALNPDTHIKIEDLEAD